MARIDDIKAEETKDSRGRPTVMVTMRAGDISVSAKVPSGKSAGSREALELRDEDGAGVSIAIANVNGVIRDALLGTDLEPLEIDQKLSVLDGTENKSNLGANATLGVSMAGFRLAAKVRGIPLWKLIAELSGSTPSYPRLYMNMLNGGVHAGFRMPFQEYIVVVGGENPSIMYKKATDIFTALGTIVKEKFGEVPFGDEGGYSPQLTGIETPFQIIHEAVDRTHDPETFLAIDAAASEFYKHGKYMIEGDPHDAHGLLEIYRTILGVYGVKSIEDPFHESDFSAFETMTAALGAKLLIVGDDLTVTNPRIVKEMFEMKRANAMIIKPNQIGTLKEVFETVRLARDAGWKLIASHRSGETDDTFIADLAVGIGAYGLKAGAPSQPERRVKYERLLEIEKEFESSP